MPAISSTFDSQEPFLKDILQDVHSGKLQLPDFQRPWVWDDVHIRSLLASVSLAYPIGAVMLLQTGGDEVRFRPRVIAGVAMSESPDPERLILDGQQRLTSLYGALMSGKPVDTKDEKQRPLRRWYYFDIAKCLNPAEDRLDAVVSIPHDRTVRSDFGRQVDLDVSTRVKEFEAGLVPATVMLGTEFSSWRTAYMQYFRMASEHVELITRFEQEVWMRVQQFKLPVIQLLRNTPKEAVCQVFEKVNTGGVALTVFELMTATFAADDFPLREDWEARKSELHERDVLSTLGGTDFLQSVTLLASYRRHRTTGSAVSVKRKDVLRLTVEGYKANAADVQAGLIRAGRLLSLEMVLDSKNLPYGTQLIPLGAACAFLGDRFEEESVRRKLAQWYWCGVLGEMYGGANETRYALDIQDLVAWIADGGEEPRSVRDASFSPMRLLTLQTRNSAAYKGLFALMVQMGSEDFMNGDPIAHTTGFALPVDIHHVFPRAWCVKQGIAKQRWNSVINKAPLTSRTNQILSGSAPSAYLQRLIARGAVSAERLDEILGTHAISPVLLRSDDFDAFIRDRATRLLGTIEVAMGKPVQGRDAEDVVEAFGGVLQ